MCLGIFKEHYMIKSDGSRSWVLYKMFVQKKFTKFTRKHLLQVRILVKLQIKNKTQVNYYGFRKISITIFDKGNLK